MLIGQGSFLKLPAWQENLLVLDRLLDRTFLKLREGLKFPIKCFLCWDQYAKKKMTQLPVCHKINVKESCKNYKQPFLSVQEALYCDYQGTKKSLSCIWSFINFNNCYYQPQKWKKGKHKRGRILSLKIKVITVALKWTAV